MFVSSAPAPKTVSDLQRLTGLKEERAKECFEAVGGYSAALASFVQSFETIPASYFDDRSVITTNAQKINTELREIYKKARGMKVATGKSDSEVWKSYDTAPASATPFAAPKAAPAPNPFGASATPPSTGAFVNPFTQVKPAGDTAAPLNFGFGAPAPYITQASSTIPSAFAAFGAKAPAPVAAAPAAVEAVKTAKRPVKYQAPTHYTGPFFGMPTFWEKEVVGRAPLLNLNNGFLEAHKEELRHRLEKWVKRASFYSAPVKYVEIEDDDEEVVRVIIKDADRTFFEPEHRAKFVAFLNAMYHEFNAYGQAMSYLAGLCMLVLNEAETASVIRFVATEYVKGHWAAEAVGFATSAWVVEYFMQELFPDVAAHLQSLNFWPDTYLQKILTGLCIHVLQFNELFDFLDAFMEGGMGYLIRFCLAIVEHFRSDLLAIQSSVEANTLYELMRLDSRAADLHDIRAIMKRAPTIDLGENASSIDLIRSKVYETKVAPRLQRAPKTETFEPCGLCDVNRPKWWNEDLGAVCDSCKEANPESAFEKY